MRIVLAPYGTLGDVQPLLALALALRHAGHDVLLCGPPESKEMVQEYGCPFQSLGSNLKEATSTVPEPALHPLKASFWLTRYLIRQFHIQLPQMLEVLPGANLLLSASLNFAAPTAAEATGVPYRFVAYCPQLFPSAHHPSLMIRNHDWPAWFNRFSWWSSELLWNLGMKAQVNRERRLLGLVPVSNFVRHWLGEHVIVASDAALGSVPGDVTLKYTQTGYFCLDQKGELGKDLQAFLDAGTCPVYAGFGSMVHEAPEKVTRLVLEAAREAGARLVLSRGWAGLGSGRIEEDCFVADHVPHQLLFPRVAAVIHHGGSGTTATAARAGAPQIIVPHMTDQFYWAGRIPRLGLGPKPIWRSRLTASYLAAGIRECLLNETIRRQARAIAQTLQGQKGVRAAVQLIESEFSRLSVK